MKLHRRYIKSYKKNTLAILFSISLTVALITCLLIITHTDHRIKAMKNQYLYGASEFFISNLSSEQVKMLQSNKKIKYLEVERGQYRITTKDNQYAFSRSSNQTSILRVSKLLEGRMPQTENEVVAERWVLKNIGVNPAINTEFTLGTEDMNEKVGGKQNNVTFKLVGILNDIPFNKVYGETALYTALENKNYSDLQMSMKFHQGVDGKREIQNIRKLLHVEAKNIHENIWLEDKNELLIQDIIMITILLMVCTVVISGVYRIALLSRTNQYGILRALGMKTKQLRKVIAGELYTIYIMSIPMGIAFGFLCSYIISVVSKDRSMKMYFWGKREVFHLVIPVIPILICILGVGIILSIVVIMANIKVNRQSIVATIYRVSESENRSKHFLSTKPSYKLKPYIQIGLKYVFRDLKTAIFIILSIGIGCSLFFGVFYQAELARINSKNEKEIWFLNGDYRMDSKVDDMKSREGIKKETVDAIAEIEGVSGIETQMAIPIKVIDNEVQRNKRFLKKITSLYEKKFNILFKGYDGVDQIYMTKLKGYNQEALKALESFIAEGNFHANKLNGDQVILFIPKTSTYGASKGTVGYNKQGVSIMQYHVGEEIKIKYRKDMDTSSDSYWQLKDGKDDYSYKKFEIAAIVYYPYMKGKSVLEKIYPLFIVSEKQFRNLFPIDTYTSVNILVNKQLGEKTQNQIDEKLIDLAIKNQEAVSRSLMDQKKDIDTLYHKELVYLYGVAVVVFLLVLINVINNLKYRIQTRKKEFCIYRALGMNLLTIRKVIYFENLILSSVSLIITFFVSGIIGKELYKRTSLSDFGISYFYGYGIYLIIGSITLILSYIISRLLVKELKDDNIVEFIEDVE